MRTYHVFRGTEYSAKLSVHDDGKKDWTIDSDWKDFWLDTAKREWIEEKVDESPNRAELLHGIFTIKLQK